MKVVSIGRRSSNDVVIKDSLVSREQHCLITEENGHYYILDSNSTNGTYVNGSRIPSAVKTRLHRTDVVRIGNTVLPWQSYFKSGSKGGHHYSPIPSNSLDPSSDDPQEATTTALQAIALVLSLIGLCCIGYAAIKIMSYGIFGYIATNAIGLVGAGCSLIALILAEIAEYKEETDNTLMATIAEWVSSGCLFTVVAFFVYWHLNPDMLNPFRNMLN